MDNFFLVPCFLKGVFNPLKDLAKCECVTSAFYVTPRLNLFHQEELLESKLLAEQWGRSVSLSICSSAASQKPAVRVLLRPGLWWLSHVAVRGAVQLSDAHFRALASIDRYFVLKGIFHFRSCFWNQKSIVGKLIQYKLIFQWYVLDLL